MLASISALIPIISDRSTLPTPPCSALWPMYRTKGSKSMSTFYKRCRGSHDVSHSNIDVSPYSRVLTFCRSHQLRFRHQSTTHTHRGHSRDPDNTPTHTRTSRGNSGFPYPSVIFASSTAYRLEPPADRTGAARHWRFRSEQDQRPSSRPSRILRIGRLGRFDQSCGAATRPSA